MTLYKITVMNCYGESFIVTTYAHSPAEAISNIVAEGDWSITNIESVA